MNIYETIIMLNTNMSAKETKEEIKKYTDMIQSYCETKKIKAEDMGIKKLAYPIKETHTEGYYIMFTFMAHPDNIRALERQFRIDDQVLKFLAVKLEEDTETELEDYIPNDESPINISEQKQEEKPDALDVLLGFADYKKGVKKNGTNNTKRCHSKA